VADHQTTEIIMKKITVATVLAALALLTACETTEGLGRDTSKLGNDISQSAQKHDGNSKDD
jgi:predicted small secreted protein